MNKNEISDIDLYNQYIEGNDDAFNIIVNRYRKKLISYIMRFVKNIETAEDISQEVFIYMFKSKKKYDFKYKFETYLYRIAKSRTINYIKCKKEETHFDENAINEYKYIEELDNVLIKKEETDELLRIINSLKDEYKEAIYLKDIKGLNYKEICYKMDKNMQQIKSLIHRARIALKNKINKDK